ncbi:MAG: hypothetical protein ACE5JB_00795 [bacterium]
MKCQQFIENLQTMLDNSVETLPAAAERHRQSCESCRLIHTHMLNLQNAARKAPIPKLSSRAETLLTHRIVEKIAPRNKSAQPSFWYILSDIIKALRWERVFITGALITASLVIVLRLTKPNTPEATNVQTRNDIEILLEEHTMAMDSGIFQSNTQYANLVTTTEQE